MNSNAIKKATEKLLSNQFEIKRVVENEAIIIIQKNEKCDALIQDGFANYEYKKGSPVKYGLFECFKVKVMWPELTYEYEQAPKQQALLISLTQGA